MRTDGPPLRPFSASGGFAGLRLAGPVGLSVLLTLALMGLLAGVTESRSGVPWPSVLGVVLASLLLLLGFLWGIAALQPYLGRWLVLDQRLPPALVVAEIRDAAPYMELLTRQLQGALQEAEQGVTTIVGALNQMNEVSLEELARIEVSKHNGGELLTVVHEKMKLDQQLGLILEMFVQKLEQDVSENLGRVQRLQEVKALEPLIDVIARIARQINLLSINAAVEAVRAGHSGNGFAVLAAEIRQLSNQTAATVKDIASKIQIVTSGVDKELEAATSRANRNTAVGNMHKVLADIYDMQKRFNEAADKNDIERVFGSLGQGHRALVELMTQALGEMQFHDVMRQRVDQVQVAIHELNEHLQGLASLMERTDGMPHERDRLRDLLAAQADRYVMHSQVSTHQQTVGVGDAAPAEAHAAPRIELF